VATRRRDIERVAFAAGDISPVTAWMDRLAAAADGWINVLPQVGDNDEKQTRLGFVAMFGGGNPGVTMFTWIPGRANRRRPVPARLGIAHITFGRAVATLRSHGVDVPQGWTVKGDHPRRGLVLELPPGVPSGQVVAWALRAVEVLTPPLPIRGWVADVHLPVDPRSA
jgi:hypothetical protein